MTTILCIHGVGHAEANQNSQQNQPWNELWIDAITNAFRSCDNRDPLEFPVVAYDHLFEAAPLNPLEYPEALLELLASAAVHAIAGPSPAKAFGPPDLGKYAGRWFAEWWFSGS